jgi:hypothetical protein
MYITAPAAAAPDWLQASSTGGASTTDLPQPEWLPEAAVPALKFLNQTDFKLKDTCVGGSDGGWGLASSRR